MPDGLGPRNEDLLRHLADLVARSYEGATSWPDRLAVFHRAVELLDPVVCEVLDQVNGTFLESTGEIIRSTDEDDDGSVWEHWELSWPRQRAAISRFDTPVTPVRVSAWFRRNFNHPHLRGSTAGDWPLQVTTTDDAARQEPVVRAIVEAEVHQKIYEGRWTVLPLAVSEYGSPGSQPSGSDTAAAARRAATSTGSQTGEKGGA